MKLSEITNRNKHAIELIDRKQLLYKLIYTLSPVKLETFKVYIKIHLKTKLI